MNTQYFHDMYQGFTYAVDVSFNREDLLECLHHFDQDIAFNIGKSILHPNDNYDKKVGRKISKMNLKPMLLRFDSAYQDPLDKNRLYITFKDENTMLYYKFRVNSKSEKPHFVEVSAY